MWILNDARLQIEVLPHQVRQRLWSSFSQHQLELQTKGFRTVRNFCQRQNPTLTSTYPQITYTVSITQITCTLYPYCLLELKLLENFINFEAFKHLVARKFKIIHIKDNPNVQSIPELNVKPKQGIKSILIIST